MSQPATRVPFWKMSGSGNDFVVIDNRTNVLPPEEVRQFTIAVCQRRVALGADGVVLVDREVTPESGADVRWRYINADGSDGELCGNGAMCGARFAFLHGMCGPRCLLETDAGLVVAELSGERDDPRVWLAMPRPGAIRRISDLAIEGRSYTFEALTVGVPHAVLVVDDVAKAGDRETFDRFGRAVRRHPVFEPAGTNVNVIAVLGLNQLRMRTYERGVEAETLACGTGAVAGAIVATTRGLVQPPVTVVTSGGRELVVDFAREGADITDVSLSGEASVVASGELWPEVWRESRAIAENGTLVGR